MPIYAYRCEVCGFAKDVLQKMSDAQLTQCPSCGKSSFKKQVTAAAFQLKGSGWYATDFRGGAKAANGASGAENSAAGAASESGTAVAATPVAPVAPVAATATTAAPPGVSAGSKAGASAEK